MGLDPFARVYCLMHSPWIRDTTIGQPRPIWVSLDSLEQFRDETTRAQGRIAELMDLIPTWLHPMVKSNRSLQKRVSESKTH